ncbi:MAG: hypothetical protein WBA57_14485 [Elainellaceae cyanobacterium]
MTKLIDINVTIKSSILFALGFVITGFVSKYAIALGFLGGVVAGFIAKGWQTKELPQSGSAADVDLIGSVKKIRERFVRLGADGKPTEDEGDDDSSDAENDFSALKKTKTKPEMGWFGIKYIRKSRR